MNGQVEAVDGSIWLFQLVPRLNLAALYTPTKETWSSQSQSDFTNFRKSHSRESCTINPRRTTRAGCHRRRMCQSPNWIQRQETKHGPKKSARHARCTYLYSSNLAVKVKYRGKNRPMTVERNRILSWETKHRRIDSMYSSDLILHEKKKSGKAVEQERKISYGLAGGRLEIRPWKLSGFLAPGPAQKGLGAYAKR